MGVDPVGRTVADMLPEADSQGFVDILAEVFHSGQPFQAHEIRFELSLPDGGIQPCYFNRIYKPVRDGDGRIDSTLIVATDVTDVVAYRDDARQSQRQLQIALESGRMGSWRMSISSSARLPGSH